ncbi:MAG: GIY-YIG nuclease family protein [Flavobacteriaceae bacterium]
MKNKGIIYKAENMENGYVYIGTTTKSIEERKGEHIRKANKGNGHGFQEAIATYGKEAFRWEQIDTADSVNELAQKEKNYIYEYNSKENGYNSDSGGGFKKTVYQYNLKYGSLIATYDCLENAGNSVNATKQSISSACLSVNNTYKGFYWSYENKEPFKPDIDKRKKEIIQLDSGGVKIATYVSVAEASRQTGISKTSLSRVCRGEREKTHGFVFKYK